MVLVVRDHHILTTWNPAFEKGCRLEHFRTRFELNSHSFFHQKLALNCWCSLEVSNEISYKSARGFPIPGKTVDQFQVDWTQTLISSLTYADCSGGQAEGMEFTAGMLVTVSYFQFGKTTSKFGTIGLWCVLQSTTSPTEKPILLLLYDISCISWVIALAKTTFHVDRLNEPLAVLRRQ